MPLIPIYIQQQQIGAIGGAANQKRNYLQAAWRTFRAILIMFSGALG